MSPTVCLSVDMLGYPEGGGLMWAYLNWALGLRENGCDVIWLERGGGRQELLPALRERLAPFGLDDSVAIWSADPSGTLTLSEAAERADLLLNLLYATPEEVVARFRRTALVDIDPGLTQYWIACGAISPPRHDAYFTIGEGVEAWAHTAPPVSLAAWPPVARGRNGAFTTVTHWSGDEWVEEPDGEVYDNSKRAAFLPYLDLPSRVTQPLELAVLIAPEEEDERSLLLERGWRLTDPQTVASTPCDYRSYIQGSLGEFSCAKPSTIRQQHAWLSDRTVCYLASGKPAIVQHTGPSRILPDAEGVWRFRDVGEAARGIEAIASDYERHSAAARALAEEHFDAKRVVSRVLERTLD